MQPNTHIDTNYKRLLTSATSTKAPGYISVGIEKSIHKAQVQRDIIRGISYAIATCLAVAAFVPAFKSLLDAMIGSGFTSYASVLLTDGGNLIGSWKEIGMVLVESLPMLSLTAVVALLVGSIYSFNKSFSYMKDLRTLQI
ncbi:MAG: hypothetical protein WCO48_00830 [Candidatus Taylorbacteria bacterium]